MTNYELVPAQVPANREAAERLEKMLEQASARGGELVCALPTPRADVMLLAFRVGARGALENMKSWG